MQKFYTLTLFFVLSITGIGCSKDVLKRYEERIVGSWELVDVDRQGFGGSTSNLPFRDGRFKFEENGSLIYTDINGSVFSGSWEMDYAYNYDQDGDNETVRTLQIVAINFTSQEVRTEYFNEVRFTSTNKFRAFVRSGWRNYVFYFERR